MELKFDAQGLIPAVVQDAESGAVLMVAWMNEEALQRTEETGEAHFWSRSRQELWHKGGTSGNVQRVREIRVDCDADTLLLRVEPAGPACHTGEQSCFYRTLAGEEGVTAAPGEILEELFALLQRRRVDAPADSYTAQLLQAGEDEIVKKVGEEAVEIILAVKGQGNKRLVEESADLLYHLLVLLVARDLQWQDVLQELARRR